MAFDELFHAELFPVYVWSSSSVTEGVHGVFIPHTG